MNRTLDLYMEYLLLVSETDNGKVGEFRFITYYKGIKGKIKTNWSSGGCRKTSFYISSWEEFLICIGEF